MRRLSPALWLIAGCVGGQKSGDSGARQAPSAEICGDGADNDADGLLDCEDGDCAAGCAEECADEADNDADGLMDCQDDDCLGDAACPLTYRAQLLGGIAGVEWSLTDPPGSDHAFLRIHARDVSGALQTLSASGALLGSCGWRFDSASFEDGANGSVSSFGFAMPLLKRGGFSIDSGCAYADSAFLRPHADSALLAARYAWDDRSWLPASIAVYPSAGAAYRDRFPWYFGHLLSEDRTTHLSTQFGALVYQLSPASFTFQ